MSTAPLSPVIAEVTARIRTDALVAARDWTAITELARRAANLN